MKTKTSIVAAALILTLVSARAAGTNDATTELKDLVAKIQIKLKAGQRTEAALAPELKQFDALLAEHQGEKTDAAARILLMKAQLYSEVFQDQAKGDELMQQLKREYQGTKLVAALEKQEEREKAAAKIQSSLTVGTIFPDFNERDLNGKSLSIANYKGKVVLVDFWATWCGPCRGEVPNVVATYRKYHGKGFEIIGVSLDQDQQKLLAYAQEQGMTWPQFFDGKGWDNKLAMKYGIESIPASYLLDGNGKIIARDPRGDALEPAVAKAVAGN